MVKEIQSTQEFDQLLADNKSKLVVVDFYANWCGPCVRISPRVQSLSDEHSDVVIVKVDVDKQRELTERCKINCMPTFQFYKNGELLDKLEGASEDRLESLIKKHK